MAEIFPLFVSYQQVAVFNHSLDDPFNDWEPSHVSQGFSWRANSVSFRVPAGENCIVEVLEDNEMSSLTGEATRVILTPFERTKNDTIVVGSITEEKKTSITAGQKFQLIFELLPDAVYQDKKFENAIRLRFAKDDDPVFELRKADSDMDTTAPLNLVAHPAQ